MSDAVVDVMSVRFGQPLALCRIQFSHLLRRTPGPQRVRGNLGSFQYDRPGGDQGAFADHAAAQHDGANADECSVAHGRAVTGEVDGGWTLAYLKQITR